MILLVISIAMATYNGEKYINEQLSSLLKQSRLADEVIIIDDLSNDNTADIVRKFISENKLANWKLFINESNLGYKKNFYQAISRTTGDLIFLCDQDDIWNVDKLECMERIFEENRDIMALNTRIEYVDEMGKPIDIRGKNIQLENNLANLKLERDGLNKIDMEAIWKFNIAPGCTMGFTKQIKDIYLQKSECTVYHDWEINFIACTMGGLYFYDQPLIKYRIHNNTVGLAGLNKREPRLLDKRTSAVYSEINRLEQFKKYVLDSENIDRILNFQIRRYNALKEKSLVKILWLHIRYAFMKNGLTLKNKIGDIVMLIKG